MTTRGDRPSSSDAKSAGVQTPAQSRDHAPTQRSNADEIAAFLQKARSIAPHSAAGRGRLIFALDATLSRQPTWDMACRLQAEMFHAAGSDGGLEVRLVYYRGFNECRASPWLSDSAKLAKMMSRITCEGGQTQIGRVLGETRREAVETGVRAVVFVGDAMEEDADHLCARAGELGLLGVPVFMFQEGRDAPAEATFREIARLSGGAWCPFDPGAASQLRDLLRAAAAYASGGREALRRLASTEAVPRKLLAQIR